MIKNNKMLLNAALSIAQVLFMGFSAFIVYKLVLDSLGAELLGTWSLIFSISSVANVANLGVANSLVKFVAVYHNDGNWKRINHLIGTGLLVVAGMMGIVVLTLFLYRTSVIKFLLNTSNSDIGQLIFPLSLISLWINTVGAIFIAVLDGFKETYLRNIIYIFSAILFVGFTYFLLPIYGIQGLGYAQILQGLVVLIGSLITIMRYDKKVSFRKMNISIDAFKEIFSYSFKFQIVTIVSIVVDPIVKFYLVRFGSLSDVGYYEMSNRLVSQVRQLIVSANSVVVPVIAQNESSKEYIVSFYKTNFIIVSICSVLVIGGLMLITPIISLIWIGKIESFFVFSTFILSCAYIINLHTVPANFTNLGTGNLWHLIYSTSTVCILNVILGFGGGLCLGGLGVLCGWACSIVIGALLQMYLFRKHYHINYFSVYDNVFWKYSLSFISMMTISLVYFFYADKEHIHPYFTYLSILLLMYVSLILYYTKDIILLKKIISSLNK